MLPSVRRDDTSYKKSYAHTNFSLSQDTPWKKAYVIINKLSWRRYKSREQEGGIREHKTLLGKSKDKKFLLKEVKTWKPLNIYLWSEANKSVIWAIKKESFIISLRTHTHKGNLKEAYLNFILFLNLKWINASLLNFWNRFNVYKVLEIS